MTCREVDRFWDVRLDAVRAGATTSGAVPIPTELEAHLGRCPRCRAKAAGFMTLARAIDCLEPAPTPTAGLSGRILAAVAADGAPSILPIRPAHRRLPTTLRRAAVAAAVLLTLAGLRAMRPDRGPEPAPTVADAVPVPSSPSRPLAEAVAEAAEATVAIARKTSGPASRIGRDVFGPAIPGDLAAVADEPTAPVVAEAGAADRVVELIGDGLEAGVRPLSRPTRSAFGFLLPNLPTADDPQPPGRGA